MARPKIIANCVASRYQARNERILEVSHDHGGALISLRATDTGRLVIDLYELDDTVEVSIATRRRATGRVPALNPDHAIAATMAPHEQVTAVPEAAVITVADLQKMVGCKLTHTELADVRTAVNNSSIGEALGDVISAVTDRRRRELTDTVRAFRDPTAFHGCLGSAPLALLTTERIAQLLAGIETATGLALIRILCGEDARLCVDDPATGRLFEVSELLDAWLHGDVTAPGLTADWIGLAVDDLNHDELIQIGPHDYLLPETTTQCPG